MTPDQIIQLRQLMFEIFAIADNDEPLPVEGEPLCSFPRIKNLAEQALALLPCETCNGTKRKTVFYPGQREFGGDASTSREIPCPDCKEPEKACTKEGDCTRYMDGTCADCPDYK